MTNFSGRWDLLDTVELDGKFYRLVRQVDQNTNDQSHLPFVRQQVDEPPYSDGLPAVLSEPQYTWHLGGLKSRQGIPGTSEYGQNTDGSWAFRLLPSAKINELTLTSSTETPTSIFEALGQVWALCGATVHRINPSTDAVTLSGSFGGGVKAVMGMRWETDIALITTDANTNSLWSISALGAPDTYNQTADVEAYRIAAGINRLFKITKTGELKNCPTGLNPLTDANWADQVQVGETSTLPTALIAYERTVLAGKPEGLFGVGDNGLGLPLVKRMARETSNCFGAATFDPWAVVPHVRGLYRYLPGTVETIGIERELLNESPINGRWQAFTSDGEWLYGAMLVGSNTYILKGRERRGGESGFSSIIWDTWLYFTGTCKALWISALSTNPRLYFGRGNNIGYVELTTSPGAVAYATAGDRYMPRLKFDDWNPKDFSHIDLVGKNLDANNYWIASYSIDGGAFVDTDINNVQMKLATNGRTRFHLRTTAVGREIQWKFSYVYDGSGSPPELNYAEAFAVPQSKTMGRLMFNLVLEEGIRHGQGSDSRTAEEQLNDLLTLSESASAVSSKGPWGEDVNVWIKSPRIVDMIRRGQDKPLMVVQLSLQIRESE